MKCPRDNTDLVPIQAPQALHCPTCHGLWVEAQDFSDLVSKQLPPPPADAAAVQTYEGRRHAPIACLVDGHAPLEQMVLHGVQVDVCRQHKAFWLDGGEYEQLIRIHRARSGSTSGEDRPNSSPGYTAGDVAVDVASSFLDVGSFDFAGEILEATVEFIGDVIGGMLG